MRQEMLESGLSRFTVILAVVFVLAVLAAVGCTSNSVPTTTAPTSTPTTPVPTSTPPTTPIPGPYTVHVASKPLIGNYLADPRGRTLYYTVSDRPGYSNLPDEALSSWPVFYVADIIVPPSLNLADFGTFTRDNNVKQTTYRGYPLYYFIQDKIAGDTFGNKLGGVWFVVNPDNFPPKY